MPKWNGIDSRFLHLIHFSNQIPFYLKDSDGLINSADTLYFLGSRATGDSTFWDNYATLEPFFLYYSSDVESPKLQLIENSIPVASEITSIPVNMRMEKDRARSAETTLKL